MKRPLALMLAIVLALSLAACKSGGSNNPDISSYSTAAVGDTIQFGKYNWLVLDIQGDRILILSDRVVAEMRYHNENQGVTWAESDMRQYLNGKFFNDSFSKAEKALIAETENANKPNQWYNTEGGADTADKVFLLSLEEVVEYLGDSGQLGERPQLFEEVEDVPSSASSITDEYNSARVAMRKDDDAATWWWLRSPGKDNKRAAIIDTGGSISVNGGYVYYTFTDIGGVRPALWLNLNS